MAKADKIQNIFDAALKRVQNGEDISTVVSAYPQALQEKLTPLLLLSQSVIKLPVKNSPAPMKRKLFLQHQPVKVSRLRIFVSTFNFAPLAIVAIVLLITGTAYASTYAIPGEPLFALKKATENFQLALTTNPEHKAALQIEIAAQRLEDAQKVFSNKSDSALQQVALNELNDQTVVALNNVKDIATSNSSGSQNLVNQVEQVTQNQNNLLAKINPAAAENTAAQNQVAINDIKNLIAATEQQNAAKISPPASITATGTISTIKDNNITIGVNTFQVQPGITEIQEREGDVLLTAKQLSVGDEVTVTANTKDNVNLAITIIRSKHAPVTPPAPSDTDNTSSDTNTGSSQNSAPPQNEAPLTNPQDVSGGFIPESPAPTVPANLAP